MDIKTLEQEKNHLKKIQKKLEDAKSYIETGMKGLGDKNLEILKELRQNPETNGADLFFFLEQLHEQNQAFNIKDKYKRLEELRSLLLEAYFARLDLKELKEEKAQSYYIGKFGFTDDVPLIIDWRAKLASVYYRYRYPQKNITYETPDGLVKKDLTLKRSFEIDRGELVRFFNNDIQLEESQILNSKLQKRTGGILEDIVETIQESQLDIIEADPRQICIVQGCVGSGKSTVAIHKLSHIFFNFPELIHPERSILIAKNQILVGYLSTLFPKLGIFDINYKTLKDLIVNVLFAENIKIKYDFELSNDLSNFTLDTHKQILDKVKEIHEYTNGQLDELSSDKEFDSFSGFVYNWNQTPIQNLSEFISELEEEVSIQQFNLSEHSGSAKEWLWKENIRVLKKLISKLKKLRTTIREVTLSETLKHFGVHTTTKIGYYESLVLLAIYGEIVGIDNIKKFEYCVVDEGQDFGLLEYIVLSKIVINSRFCILGDLNQSYQKEGLTSWDEISKVIKEATKANTYVLDTNYRSTKQIIDFANLILSPFTKTYLPKSINRVGIEPNYKTYDDRDKAMDKLKSMIVKDLEKMDKSVGLICFSKEDFEELDRFISTHTNKFDDYIKLDSKKRISYIPKGLYLSKFEDCKGLEFSKVYVMGYKLSEISNYTEAKKYFVSVTRAMNELVVLDIK